MALTTAAMVIGAATTAYSAKKAGDRADQASEAMEGQQETARQKLAFNKAQYADWKKMFEPVYGDLKAMAYEDNRPDYGAIDADIAYAFDTSQGINQRNLQRYGVSPTDGAFQASARQYGLGRAMAEVSANQDARREAEGQQWNRMATFANLGAAQRGQAVAGINSSYGSMMNSQGNMANMYSNQAAGWSQAAAAGAGMMGRGIGAMDFGGGGGDSIFGSGMGD